MYICVNAYVYINRNICIYIYVYIYIYIYMFVYFIARSSKPRSKIEVERGGLAQFAKVRLGNNELSVAHWHVD